MKKNLSILFLLFIILSITACGKSDESFISEQTENRNENNDKTDAPITGKNGHYLVLYSSRTNNTAKAIIRLSKLLSIILTIMTLYLSVIRSGTEVWQHRCRVFCANMLQNFPENK